MEVSVLIIETTSFTQQSSLSPTRYRVLGSTTRSASSVSSPQRLYFGHAVQPQQLPQLFRRVFLEIFRALNPQQGEQDQAQHGGPQPIEGGTDGAKQPTENIQPPVRQ